MPEDPGNFFSTYTCMFEPLQEMVYVFCTKHKSNTLLVVFTVMQSKTINQNHRTSEANNFRFQNIDKLKARPSFTPAQFSTSELLFKM